MSTRTFHVYRYDPDQDRQPYMQALHMTGFFKQYHSIKPYLVNADPPPEIREIMARRAL